MSFKVVIPARYASTRLPQKPLADIAGKPMVVRVAEQAVESGAEEVWIAVDHQAVFDAVVQHGFNAVMTRMDHVSGTDRIAEVAERVPADGYINIQGDEPLMDPAVIDAVAGALDRAEMSTASTPIREVSEYDNPNVVKVVVGTDGRALYFSRRTIPYLRDFTSRPPAEQLAAFPFRKHLGIYGFRRETLIRLVRFPVSSLEAAEKLEQLRALENGIAISVAAVQHDSIGVDVPSDVDRVEALLRSLSSEG